MNDIAIRVENIGKLYRLGEVGTGTLSHDLNRWLARIRGKEDPFAKVGEVNDRTKKGESEYVWALQDVSFTIGKGQAVGIIGNNGAGKSTLLKILSKVTSPTTGKIKLNGRIASLLEVGTGFHPELTGRENIYLNGTILGMTRFEIKRKFDEIVDFAGVERYIDTPVKRYSSGMYVRLAFGVAAHLESEILIVDEVLAVGDAEFQKKCLGKMNDVTQEDGRTVLFVSHNMNSIASLCATSILMKHGKVDKLGPSKEIIKYYQSSSLDLDTNWINFNNEFASPHFNLHSIKIVNQNKDHITDGLISNNERVGVQLDFEIIELHSALCVGIAVYNENNETIFWSNHTDHNPDKQVKLQQGENSLVIWFPANILNEGDYIIKPMVSLHWITWIINPESEVPKIRLTIKGGLSESTMWTEARPGILAPVLLYERL